MLRASGKKQTVSGLDPGLAESGLCSWFVFHQNLNTPIFSSSLAGKKNWAQQRALHLPALTAPLSLLQSLGARRSRACFTRIICLVAGWLYFKSVPQRGKWMLVSNLLKLKKKDLALGNQFVTQQGIWWEPFVRNLRFFYGRCRDDCSHQDLTRLEGRSKWNALPICWRTWHCPLQLYETDFKITCWKRKGEYICLRVSPTCTSLVKSGHLSWKSFFFFPPKIRKFIFSPLFLGG